MSVEFTKTRRTFWYFETTVKVSGYADDVINNRVPENTLLLPKPFTRALLLRKVREALDTKTSFTSS